MQDRLPIGPELVAGIMDAVPRLIVLNGPPGCGKSTIARRYAADHPLALALDVDTVRALDRFTARSAATGNPAHREAAEMLTGGLDELARMYDNLTALVRTRPHAVVVPTEHGAEDEAYAAVLKSLR
ncbi:MAG: AAA family ATPase [Kribbellaceae bacterium]